MFVVALAVVLELPLVEALVDEEDPASARAESQGLCFAAEVVEVELPPFAVLGAAEEEQILEVPVAVALARA